MDNSKPIWLNWLEPLNYASETDNLRSYKSCNFEYHHDHRNKRDHLIEIKKQLSEQKEEIKKQFFKTSDGPLIAGLHCMLIDNLLKYLLMLGNDNHHNEYETTLSIIAIGGYGRGELAPHSDIDILFLLPNKQNESERKKDEKKVEEILYFLWDLGLRIGHSTRTIKETLYNCKYDLTFLTSLLDYRLVAGNGTLFSKFQEAFQKLLIRSKTINFVRKKLDEAEKRHVKFGSSRYVVEPNVKEGKGGLRDLQTLIWISKFAYKSNTILDLLKRGALLKSELYAFAEAYRFILSVRCHLHYRSNREDDTLATDSQIDLAEKMNFRKKASQSSVERFMKRYFLATKTVGNLTRIFCSAIEDDFKKSLRLNLFNKTNITIEKPFYLKNKKISVKHKDVFLKEPKNIIKLFYISHLSETEIHPQTLRYLPDCAKLLKKKFINNKEINNYFVDILTSKVDPSKVLRIMNEANVLGRFVPDFQKVVGLIQYDMYHYYSVDEHTIITIHNIHLLKEGTLKNISPFATEAMSEIKSFKSLMVAMFLHDIAKGRKGDHSKNGADIAVKLCPRFGLSAEDTKTVSWLILNHLLLSKIAFKYDLNDMKIIENCSNIISTLERLRLLLVLTVCDIKSVGPNVWSDWKGALIHELYIKIKDNLIEKSSSLNYKKEKINLKEKLFFSLKKKEWNENSIIAFSSKLSEFYWSSFNLETIEKHALVYQEMSISKKKFFAKFFIKKQGNVSELIVIAPDHHGLFSKISGIVSSCGIDIVSAKIFTRNDGFAIDTFIVQDKGQKSIVEKRVQKNILLSLENGLQGNYDYQKELINRWQEIPSRFRKMKAPIRVSIDNISSTNFSLIEVNCKNSPGILYVITKTLAEQGVQINSASISTYGNRVMDIFYVKDLFGQKIRDDNKLRKIKIELSKILKDTDPANEMIN